MPDKWTKEQRAAIELNGTLLVSAGAGSGKTAVLVERLIRRIMDPQNPLDVYQLLVVTFTRAAAAEMAGRLRQALEDALFQEGQDTQRLMRQMAMLDQAYICNLHAFCLELIRRYFYLLGLDPAFRVADPGEIELMRQDVLSAVLEKHYEQMTPEFAALANIFIQDRSDDGFMDILLRVSEFSLAQVHPEAWLRSLPEAYQWAGADDFLSSLWGQAIRQKLADEAAAAEFFLQTALRTARLPDGPAHYMVLLEQEAGRMQALTQLLASGDWAEIGQAIRALSFARLPVLRGAQAQQTEVSIALRELSRKWRDEAKKKIMALRTSFFAWPIGEQLRAVSAQRPLVETIAALVSEFHTAYAAEKRQRNLIDYADMEHFALRLLEGEDNAPSTVAEELQRQFQEVMIDEYQDTNPLQERILEMLVRGGADPAGFFMVGDIKQSIYRFRMADPTIFLEKFNSFRHTQAVAESAGEWESPLPGALSTGAVIDLNRNFRSRNEVIQGINAVFEQIMLREIGGITYDQAASLQYGAHYPELGDQSVQGKMEAHLIDLHDAEPEDEDAPEEDRTSLRQEARAIAGHIRRIVERELVFDRTRMDYRAARYADIVILTRSLRASAEIFQEEFQSAGVPLALESRGGYFGVNEVEIMLSLLSVMDNPHQDIPLAGVLRSVFVGLSDRDLGLLRSLHAEADLYELCIFFIWAMSEGKEAADEPFAEILRAYQPLWESILGQARQMGGVELALREKLLSFWTRLRTWRTMSRRESLPDLIWAIFTETRILAQVGRLTEGQQRQENLLLLYERARQFEATRARGLFRFLRFLEKFQKQGQDLGKASLHGEENSVRLQTIHGSKGLEYSIVFITGLGRSFNRMELNQERVLLHARLGVGLPLVDPEQRVEYPSLIRLAIRQHLFEESLAEEMRILYVAMTRAQESLYLYGTIKDRRKTLDQWMQLSEGAAPDFPVSMLRRANRFLDWLMPALLRRPEAAEIYYHAAEAATPYQERPAEQVAGKRSAVGEILPMRYAYPYAHELARETKLSVSEMKRRWAGLNEDVSSAATLMPRQRTFKSPSFAQETHTLTPAERGTVIHTAMQLAPLCAWQTDWAALNAEAQTQRVEEFRRFLVRSEFLSAEQSRLIQTDLFRHFFRTKLAGRLTQADQMRREIPFTLSLPRGNDTPVLLQGMIDILLLYADGSVEIVDYKTDYFPKDIGIEQAEQELSERYALQLSLYALAIERLLRRSVQQCTIYSVTLQREIALTRLTEEALQQYWQVIEV